MAGTGDRDPCDGNGLLLVDKPAGVTSFTVVDHVRRALLRDYPELDRRRDASRQRPRKQLPRFKCGHAGTLDPLATGLLLILVGKGSRLTTFLLGLDKSYTATVRFGCATDSLDRDGQVVTRTPPPADVHVVNRCLANLRGSIQQVPPVISALKQDGRPLYERVRRGLEVRTPPARSVTISHLELCDSRWGAKPAAERATAEPERELTAADGLIYEVDLLVHCSSGTYIRALARDLARAAGSEGHVQALRRMSIGPFGVEGSETDVLEKNGAQLASALRPLAAALSHLPTLTVDNEQAAGLRQGIQPHRSWLDGLSAAPVATSKTGPLFKMLDDDGGLVAVGEMDTVTGDVRIAAVIPQT